MTSWQLERYDFACDFLFVGHLLWFFLKGILLSFFMLVAFGKEHKKNKEKEQKGAKGKRGWMFHIESTGFFK